MPVYRKYQFTELGALVFLVLATVAGLLIPRVWLPDLLQPIPKYINAFDETLLAREPLQIGDMLASLNATLVEARRGEWRLAIRLVRDARNQWEAFQAQMPKASSSKPNLARQSATLWNAAVRQAERRSIRGTSKAVGRLRHVLGTVAVPIS
jgi:hypothetical protein